MTPRSLTTGEHMKTQIIPKPVLRDGRICFGISYFTTEADADAYSASIVIRGDTYNGGWLDGKPCGREKHRDYVHPTHGLLYAVTD